MYLSPGEVYPVQHDRYGFDPVALIHSCSPSSRTWVSSPGRSGQMDVGRQAGLKETTAIQAITDDTFPSSPPPTVAAPSHESLFFAHMRRRTKKSLFMASAPPSLSAARLVPHIHQEEVLRRITAVPEKKQCREKEKSGVGEHLHDVRFCLQFSPSPRQNSSRPHIAVSVPSALKGGRRGEREGNFPTRA